jgi:hypothetical protein
MFTALYTKTPNASYSPCPSLQGPNIDWTEELPAPLQALVVPPTRFDVHSDYEMQAEHTHGCDAANTPCYNAYRFVLTQLRSDDDEVFYEAPVYAESLTAWRLVDARWLVCRTVESPFDCSQASTSYSISDTMPC